MLQPDPRTGAGGAGGSNTQWKDNEAESESGRQDLDLLSPLKFEGEGFAEMPLLCLIGRCCLHCYQRRDFLTWVNFDSLLFAQLCTGNPF